ncbi:glycosyltransferase [Winogradskyella alexanderae]|uniref:Glycosyltransferase n=1 Tax=Winogradskyella alexanderae TaxID=2877123 RepID=A0ABS7XTX4_9FLAO|nr:glycosyltransferase [Winogradskyella alexanderae]MCA0133487.1 glycosyltransferase [Winogradskyella alexanderae]
MSSKKVLIITYYWPPAGGPGVQRWLKFVKYLPEFDIEPIVYCPENPNYPIIDNSLLDTVSKKIKVLKQPIKEPYRLARLFSKKSTNKISSGVIPKAKKQSIIERLLLYIRGNFFIPDARKNWVKPSIEFLDKYISENKIDCVVTTGPPHSLHLIGLGLKERLDLKWLADFRDPWTNIGYHKALKLTQKAKAKHQKLEKEVLNKADKLIVTSNNTKNEFLLKTTTPISVITNGYDHHNIPKQTKYINFTLSHIGSLLSERNPIILWKVLSELVTENLSFAKSLQLNLIGVVSDDVIQSIKAHKLEPFLNVVGYVEHEKAIAYQMKSRVLLLIEIDSEETKAIIPGKLFEYMISETPILALGPVGSDVETILKSTNTGVYYNYQNEIALKKQILVFYEDFKNSTLEVNAIGLQSYSRKALTKSLSIILRNI